jgi:hypothetical protein
MTLIAVFGVAALWLLYLWLVSCIIASYLSNRKGYGDKPGIATGLCLSAIAIIVWLVWPAKPESKWKKLGPFGSGKDKSAKAPA